MNNNKIENIRKTKIEKIKSKSKFNKNFLNS